MITIIIDQREGLEALMPLLPFLTHLWFLRLLGQRLTDLQSLEKQLFSFDEWGRQVSIFSGISSLSLSSHSRFHEHVVSSATSTPKTRKMQTVFDKKTNEEDETFTSNSQVRFKTQLQSKLSLRETHRLSLILLEDLGMWGNVLLFLLENSLFCSWNTTSFHEFEDAFIFVL